MSDASTITSEMGGVDERFGRLSGEYERRRTAARAAVVRWEPYSRDAFDLRPLFYERHLDRPGRRLAEPPPPGTDYERVGFDAAGRPVVVEDHSGFLDGKVSHETFRAYGEGRVEQAYYRADGDPVHLHEYRYEDGRIRSAWMATAHGVTHEEYHYTGDSVTGIVVHEARERGLPGERELSARLVQTVRASYEGGALARVAIIPGDRPVDDDAVTPLYERPPAGFTFEAAREAVREDLVARIPRTVAAMEIDRPAYCVALAYSSEPGGYLVYVGLEEAREELLSTPDGAEWIWNAPDMEGGDDADLSSEVETTARLLFQELRLADADDPTARPGTERSRDLICEVAKELNSFDWSRVLPVTGDFVVYATDMELVDVERNMAYCVPPSRLADLRSCGLL